MSSNVFAVANYFLHKAEGEGKQLTHLQLQKLVYIAHGWHLAIRGEPLFTDRIEAWPYGPVIPILYREFRECGSDPITRRAMVPDWETWDDVPAELPSDASDTRAVLDRVWQAYRGFSAAQLSTLTHQTDTPWDNVAKANSTDSPRGLPINNELIREHYRRLVEKRIPQHA